MVAGPRKLASKWDIRYFAPFLIVAMVLVLANWKVFAATGAPATSTRVRQGKVLFQKNCVTCHNKLEGDTSPFGPPNLHGIFRSGKPAITPQQAKMIIQKGRTPMPSFEGVLTPAQINTLVAYLKAQ